jgi:hypothetical protein
MQREEAFERAKGIFVAVLRLVVLGIGLAAVIGLNGLYSRLPEGSAHTGNRQGTVQERVLPIIHLDERVMHGASPALFTNARPERAVVFVRPMCGLALSRTLR